MNKAQLIDAIAEQTPGTSKATITAVLDAACAQIQRQLAEGDSVQLIGFGRFGVSNRAARRGRHPRTGAVLAIPAARRASFSAGKDFKAALNAK